MLLTCVCRTFTTSYAGSMRTSDGNNVAESGTAIDGGTWQASSEGPDMALLTARDPINFFAEVPLYESELDDNGTSQLSVKVRTTSVIGRRQIPWLNSRQHQCIG